MGSLDTSVNVDEAENQTGFYQFGDKISVNGTITELCARGNINTNNNITGLEDNVTVVGSVLFFVIREVARGNPVVGRVGVNVGPDNSTNCTSTIGNIAVQESDYILVYIRSGCAQRSNARIVCPLQVNFRSDNDSITYYNGSDSLFTAEENATYRGLLDNTEIKKTEVKMFLNVRVTIEGMTLCNNYVKHSPTTLLSLTQNIFYL